MREDVQNPQINSAKIPIGGGIAGAFCALASMVIFLIGIPVLRYHLRKMADRAIHGLRTRPTDGVALAVEFSRLTRSGRRYLPLNPT